MFDSLFLYSLTSIIYKYILIFYGRPSLTSLHPSSWAQGGGGAYLRTNKQSKGRNRQVSCLMTII